MVIVTVRFDSRAATTLLRAIGKAVNLRHESTHGRFEALVDRLADTGRLLIIDQAHDLRDSALKLVMDLHDAAELPVLLVGTVDIHKRLVADEDPQYGQLSSRVGLRCDLLPEVLEPLRGGRLREWVSIDQLAAMFNAGKLKLHREGLEMLWHMANGDVGHLRRCRHVVRLAETLALHAGHSEILAADVRAATRLVDGGGASRPDPRGPGGEEREMASVAQAVG